MPKTGIFYATISGATRRVAVMVAEALSVSPKDVFNISEVSVETLLNYDLIVLGTPTYGKGELHYVWEEVFEEMKMLDFKGKYFALFCLGDHRYHEETFAGSLIRLYSHTLKHSDNVIGKWSAHDYPSHCSPSMLADNSFPGLVLDVVNRNQQTEERIKGWCEQLKNMKRTKMFKTKII